MPSGDHTEVRGKPAAAGMPPEEQAARSTEQKLDSVPGAEPASAFELEEATQIQHPSDAAGSQLRSKGPCQAPGYTILEPLGAGTYGEVWLAQEARTGIRVAIKFFAHGAGQQWQLLQAEVKQLAQLHADPGIVHLIDVEPDSTPPYYIMAYAQQGSLAKRLEKGPLPVDAALAIFRQVAQALAYVHAKGIRHCDLKPGNILLDARGRALVADFGQAHLSCDASPALGTFFYMAPEQADLSSQIPDTRWDVYGLGALLYAMLTGRPPREDGTLKSELADTVELSHRLRRYRDSLKEAPKLMGHRRVPGVDRALADIIDRCLKINPDERPRDAADVLAALDRRERKRRQRPALVFGLVAPLLLLVVMAGAGSFVYNAATRSAHETQQAMDVKVNEKNQFIARLVAADLKDKLAGYVKLAETLATQPGLANAVKSKAVGRLVGPLEKASAVAIPPKYVWITARDGKILDIYPKAKYPDISYQWRDWFNGMGDQKEGAAAEPIAKTYISQPFVAKTDDRLMVAISTPIWDPNDENKVVGMVTATILVETLVNWIKQLDLGDSFAIILNERGQYLSHQTGNAIKPTRGAQPRSVPADSVLQQVVVPATAPCVTPMPFTDPINGKTYLGCCAPVKEGPINWVVLLQQEQGLISPAMTLNRDLFRIGLIAVAAIGLLIPILWGWLIWMVRREEEPAHA